MIYIITFSFHVILYIYEYINEQTISLFGDGAPTIIGI